MLLPIRPTYSSVGFLFTGGDFPSRPTTFLDELLPRNCFHIRYVQTDGNEDSLEVVSSECQRLKTAATEARPAKACVRTPPIFTFAIAANLLFFWWGTACAAERNVIIFVANGLRRGSISHVTQSYVGP